MGLPMISGSAQMYARNLYTQTKAMMRVENGITPQEQKQREDKSLIEAMLDPDRGSDISATSVRAKLDRGKKLSPKEMDWLQKNDPALYKKAKEVQQEREQFERELKSCKTKDDVQRLRLRYSQKICNEMQIAMKNGGDVYTAKWKFLAVEDSHMTFVKSDEYKEMPTDIELQLEKQEEKEKKGGKKKTAKKNRLLQQLQENSKTPGQTRAEENEGVRRPAEKDKESDGKTDDGKAAYASAEGFAAQTAADIFTADSYTASAGKALSPAFSGSQRPASSVSASASQAGGFTGRA